MQRVSVCIVNIGPLSRIVSKGNQRKETFKVIYLCLGTMQRVRHEQSPFEQDLYTIAKMRNKYLIQT